MENVGEVGDVSLIVIGDRIRRERENYDNSIIPKKAFCNNRRNVDIIVKGPSLLK